MPLTVVEMAIEIGVGIIVALFVCDLIRKRKPSKKAIAYYLAQMRQEWHHVPTGTHIRMVIPVNFTEHGCGLELSRDKQNWHRLTVQNYVGFMSIVPAQASNMLYAIGWVSSGKGSAIQQQLVQIQLPQPPQAISDIKLKILLNSLTFHDEQLPWRIEEIQAVSAAGERLLITCRRDYSPKVPILFDTPTRTYRFMTENGKFELVVP